MHTATFPAHVIKSCRQLNSDLHLFSCTLALFAFSCSHYLCRKEEIQYSDVGWVPRSVCETVKIPSREFKRGYSYVHAHATNISTLWDWLWPILSRLHWLSISCLEVKRADATFTLEPLAYSAMERWQMEISVWEEESDNISARNQSLQKSTV